MARRVRTDLFKLGAEVRADPAIYEALGRLIDNWNIIERICQTIIATLLDADRERTDIALSSMQAGAMLNVLRALVFHATPAKADEFRVLWVRIERAQRFRNQAAHTSITGLHGVEPHFWEDRKVRVTRKGIVTIGARQPLTAHLLRRRALYVRAVSVSLLEFMRSVAEADGKASWKPSPQERDRGDRGQA